MKRIFNLRVPFALLLAAAPLVSVADTFFTDNFTNGSTTNGLSVRAGTDVASSTSYDLGSSKNASGGPKIDPSGFLTLALNAATTSGWLEAQAIFATNPIALTLVDDYIDISVVFTNRAGSLFNTPTSLLHVGLYNSGGTPPVPNASLIQSGFNGTAGSAFATGNCANWQGYVCQISSNGTTRITTRPVQNGANTTSGNQELVANGNGTGSYVNPVGATIATTPAPGSAFTLVPDGQYTLYMRITLSAPGTLTISNSIYSGSGTGGTRVFFQTNAVATGATFLTAGFDGLAIGVYSKSAVSGNGTMDITSIAVSGVSTIVTTPPTITSQPVPVIVPSGGSCQFVVAATGFNVTYQWYRNGVSLSNGGNISGATSDTLTISPAGAGDVFSGANGYYVIATGTGPFSTNSITNSLTLGTASSLIWSGSGNVWDLDVSANWLSNGNSAVFNYGDTVTFDDSGSGNLAVTLTGRYLSAASVTVNTSTRGYDYVFSGSGSITGPGNLIYQGAGLLTMNNANSYSGGTIISNASAYLVLNNYNALGTGPVTLAMAGGQMEIVPVGNATTGINGDINVADDFSIQIDAVGAFATVFLGNFSGTANKTLTFNPKNLATTNRFRVYGNNTTMNANLVLNGPVTSQANYYGTTLAPYNPNGSQTYNGVISGPGGLIQRGNGTTILSGPNTYTGGTTPTTGTIGFGIDTVGTTPDSGPIGTGPLFLAPELPNTTGSGTVLAYGGARTIANPIQYPSATNNQTLVIGGTNNLTFSGPFTLNGNDSTGTFTNRTLQVNNTNGLTTISGVISGSGFGLIKTGSGVLALNNTETYTGPTTVSAGTLRVNGQLDAGSAVTVATNAFLGGTGTINGPVTVQPGGALSPGNSVGILRLGSSLTLSGNLSIEVNKASSPTSDKIEVSGALTNAGVGTVTVTNIGGVALVQGDTFFLFNKAMSNGAALNIIGGQVAWANNLAIDGTIAVLGPLVNLTPTNIVSSTSGGVLTLSWPADHIGWRLQVQTNSLNVGITTNWIDLAGTSTTNLVNFTISTNGTVFYRLIYP
jgi:autotransporter-associated beta strand protein